MLHFIGFYATFWHNLSYECYKILNAPRHKYTNPRVGQECKYKKLIFIYLFPISIHDAYGVIYTVIALKCSKIVFLASFFIFI